MSAQVMAASRGKGRTRRVEWPSLALCGGLYGSFALVTALHDRLPPALVAVLGAVLIAWHSSMQHEFIHGHPTPWRRLNRALAFAPLSLWLPFEAYRRSHLVHHRDDALTDPFDDPESYYWSAEGWAALGAVGRAVVRLHSTLAGRLVIGPFWNIGLFLLGEARGLLRGDRVRRRIWLGHALGVLAVVLWITVVCRMSLAFYGLAIVYPGTAILLLRSFAEHRARDGVFERSAVVEDAWLLGPVFLFNNLHAAHHERPLIPWYELPGWYRANRARLLAANGGLVYRGYGEVARRFLFVPHDASLHPAEASRGR